MTYIVAADQRTSGRGTVAGRQRNRRRTRPTLLALEDAASLSTFTVNNPTDSPIAGETDLRQAIGLANTAGGAKTIILTAACSTCRRRSPWPAPSSS